MKTNDIRLMITIIALLLDTLGLGAQTFDLIHTFADGFPNQDAPMGGVVVSGDMLYGTTSQGPSPGHGAVFSLSTNGTYTVLHPFTAASTDGSRPQAALTLSGSALYGTTQFGGATGFGTVFSMNTSGGGFILLHSFGAPSFNSSLNANTNTDGFEPESGLVLSGSTLYGTTFGGGFGGSGTIFSVNTSGGGFKVLHHFAPSTGGLTNLDGMELRATLLLSGSTLYGTAATGGTNHWGTVFSINTSGSNFTVLHSFGTNENSNGTPLDGGLPEGGLVLSGDTLYGTTAFGGIYYGTVFSLKTNGDDFSLLYRFGTLLVSNSPADGNNPIGTLILSGNTLYGAANQGGDSPNPGTGTVFSLDTNGGAFTVLHSFGALNSNTNTDGAYPPDQLVLADGRLYGTATEGGAKGGGTVFSITLPESQQPALSLNPFAAGASNLAISWPDTATGFVLESNSDLGNAAGWQIFNGIITDTNGLQTAQIPVGPAVGFFRLHGQ